MVITAMVVLSSLLSFVQEYRSDNAVWWATIILSGVLSHKVMLPVNWLSSLVPC